MVTYLKKGLSVLFISFVRHHFTPFHSRVPFLSLWVELPSTGAQVSYFSVVIYVFTLGKIFPIEYSRILKFQVGVNSILLRIYIKFFQ